MIDVKKVEDFEKLTDSLNSIATAIENMPAPSGGGGIDYSTEEQDTGLKWIDGRTIYQKTVTGSFQTTTASGSYIHYGSFNLSNHLDITDWRNSIITGILDKTYLRLSDGSYRIPFYFDFQGSGPTCSLFFLFSSRSGELTLTIQYVKGDDLP